jgi:hypothetical protein
LFVPANRRDWTTLNQLPEYPNSLMVRTDFEHEPEWQAVLKSIENPGPEVGTEYRAGLEVLQDTKLRDFGVNPLIEALPERYRHSFFPERRSPGRSAIFSSDCNAVLEAQRERIDLLDSKNH